MNIRGVGTDALYLTIAEARPLLVVALILFALMWHFALDAWMPLIVRGFRALARRWQARHAGPEPSLTEAS